MPCSYSSHRKVRTSDQSKPDRKAAETENLRKPQKLRDLEMIRSQSFNTISMDQRFLDGPYGL
jgi:hypothetical protein